jgi:hypothetical protein
VADASVFRESENNLNDYQSSFSGIGNLIIDVHVMGSNGSAKAESNSCSTVFCLENPEDLHTKRLDLASETQNFNH